MKRLATFTAVWIGLLSGSAVSKPCVGAAFDLALKGANAVVTRRADIPSPRFPGVWQEGELNGFFYALYANGEGVLQTTRQSKDWQVTLLCDQAAKTCDRVETGTPPVQALDTVVTLKHCLLGTKRKPVAPVTAPVSAPVQAPLTSAKPVVPVACGLALLPTQDAAKTLQRLLAMAGADPGPIDGLIGPLTNAATAKALGPQSASLSVAQKIAKLDADICTGATNPQ